MYDMKNGANCNLMKVKRLLVNKKCKQNWTTVSEPETSFCQVSC